MRELSLSVKPYSDPKLHEISEGDDIELKATLTPDEDDDDLNEILEIYFKSDKSENQEHLKKFRESFSSKYEAYVVIRNNSTKFALPVLPHIKPVLAGSEKTKKIHAIEFTWIWDTTGISPRTYDTQVVITPKQQESLQSSPDITERAQAMKTNNIKEALTQFVSAN